MVFVEYLHLGALPALLREAPRRVIEFEQHGIGGRIASGILRLLGIKTEIADFHAGDLRSSDGRVAYFAGLQTGNELAKRAAGEIVSRQPVLQSLDRLGRRGTATGRLEKWLLGPSIVFATRVEVARILMASHPGALVMLELPAAVPRVSAMSIASGLRIAVFGSWWKKVGVVGKAVLLELRRILDSFTSPATIDDWTHLPTVLTVREDDLGNDPSFRAQLHWIDREQPTQASRVMILPRRGPFTSSVSNEWLIEHGVFVLTQKDVGRCVRSAQNPIQRDLVRHAFACLRSAIMSWPSADTAALYTAWGLVSMSRGIAAVIEASGARAWVSGEPYTQELDAVHLVADRMGVCTVLFQFSSFATRTFFMSAATDILATFGSTYSGLYPPPPAGPRRIIPLGYLYGDVDKYVAERSARLRRSLEEAGARFVVCLFDENVQYTRWGMISPKHHRRELEELARAVLADETLGVLVKTKYSRNAPERLYAADPVIGAALATDRMKSLAFGGHRNQVFPAEAALAADLCIGHSFGSTACLEAAVFGVRSVLLHAYPGPFYLQDVLKPYDLVFGSLREILAAMQDFRLDPSNRTGFGDWTPVLNNVDFGRDGGAPKRLRNLLIAQAQRVT